MKKTTNFFITLFPILSLLITSIQPLKQYKSKFRENGKSTKSGIVQIFEDKFLLKESTYNIRFIIFDQPSQFSSGEYLHFYTISSSYIEIEGNHPSPPSPFSLALFNLVDTDKKTQKDFWQSASSLNFTQFDIILLNAYKLTPTTTNPKDVIISSRGKDNTWKDFFEIGGSITLKFTVPNPNNTTTAQERTIEVYQLAW